MKKWIPLLVILLIGFSYNIHASHLAGAEITYKATTTPGVVEVHLFVYQECTSVALCSGSCGTACTQTITITGTDPNCVNSNFGFVTLSLVNVRDVKGNLADGVKSTCTNMNCTTPGTYTPAFERYEFVGLANIGTTSGIPASCCNIRLWCTLSTRYSGINTGSYNEGIYIDATINRCQYNISPNSSPVYFNDPVGIHCSYENVQYNLGASYDPDGDSLSYNFFPALQAYNSSVTYISPWTAQTPMPWSGASNAAFPSGIRCDTLTGRVSYSPAGVTGSGRNFGGFICIEIKQWKKIGGVPTVIGRTVRDALSVILGNCTPNRTPLLYTTVSDTTNPYLSKSDWVFPSGIQSCFTITARDTDYIPPTISDTAFIDTTNSFPGLGASFTRLTTPGTTRKDSMLFCWTPTVAQERVIPYIMNVRVNDKRSPLLGRADFAFKIWVPLAPRITTTGIKDTAKACNLWDFSYTLQPNSPLVAQTRWNIYKLSSTNIPTLVTSVTSPGAYNLTNTLITDSGRYAVGLDLFENTTTGYFKTYWDTITVLNNEVRVVGTDTLVCPNTKVVLSSSISRGVAPYSIKWTNGLVVDSASKFTVTSGMIDKWVTLKVTDSRGCFYIDTVWVRAKPVPQLQLALMGDSVQCEKGNNFTFINQTNKLSVPGCLYYWLLSDSATYTGDTLARSLPPSGIQTIKLFVTTPGGCRDTLNRKVSLRASPRIAFTLNDSTQCLKNNSFVFTNQTTMTSGAAVYQWITPNSSSYNKDYTFKYPNAGTFDVKLIAINSSYFACRDSVIQKIVVYPQPTLNLTIDKPFQCLNVNKFVFVDNTVRDSSFLFRLIIEGDTSTAPTYTKSFSTPGVKSVKLTMSTPMGCYDSLMTAVNVMASPIAGFTVNDTDQCIRGNRFVFTNKSAGANAGSFLIDGSTDTNTIVAKSFSTTGVKTVRLVATNTVGNCRDTTYKQIEVLYSPTATFAISDTMPCKNIPIVLSNTSNNIVPLKTTWTFVDNTYDSSVIVTKKFSSPGIQKVSLKVVTERGCTDSTFKNITVIASPAIPVLSGPTNIKPDSIVTYSVVANTALNYQWKVDNGRFISSNLDTSSVNVKWDSTSAYGRIFLSTKNAQGCNSDTTRYDISIIGGVGLAVVNSSFQNLSVFPNPTSDAITLSLNSNQSQDIQVKLYNLVGTEVKTLTYKVSRGLWNEQINLHDFQKGIYFMRIEGEAGSQTVKILLK